MISYSINVTLDGCVDHRAIVPTEDIHRHGMESIARADAVLFGRATYELMLAWRDPSQFPASMQPFADVINRAKKYVVSSKLTRVDWNTELVKLDAIPALAKDQRLALGGVTLPRALAERGLIDEFEFVVQPRVVGHGPRLFEGLQLDLQRVAEHHYPSGAIASRYVRTPR